ncbi:unnamed protein product [Ectocarpus sp. 6 AP-2014]
MRGNYGRSPPAHRNMAAASRRLSFRTLLGVALLLGLTLTILAAVAVQSEPAIPFDGYGHVILRQGTLEAALKVEVYLDLACSDCALAWPVMNRVAEAYGDRAEFLYRLFPLPYHNNAFKAAKAAKTIQLYSRGSEDASVASFFTEVFIGQDEISNDSTKLMTQPQIEAILESWATSSSGMSADNFHMGMADAEVEIQTRNQFKYGCLHDVDGTPQVYIGGILASELDGDATFRDWQDTLDALLSRTSSAVPWFKGWAAQNAE